VGLAVAALLCAIVLRAQDLPAPVFRGGVDVVHVDVSVLDKDRKPVRGLNAADFTVLEDGKPRPIVAFAPVELPGPAPAETVDTPASWLRDVPVDVATNRVSAEGRLLTIVFDWSIRLTDQPLARRIARAAVENMGPQDLAAVIFTTGFANAGTGQNFTSDKGRLLEAINRPMTPAREGIDHARDAMAPDPLDRQPHPWLFDPDGEKSGECLCRVCVFDKVGDVADAVAGIPGRRKTMLFIGTYFPSPSPAVQSPCREPVRTARDLATQKLHLANVTIHVVDPAGAVDLDTGPVPGDGDTAKAAGWEHTDGLVPLTEMSRQDRLPFLANLTGGRVVMHDNGAETKVPAILDETSSYYVLAFPSADQGTTAGRAHKIEVRVGRRDVDLQYRRTYQAGQTPAALEAASRKLPLVRAIEATLPRTDETLTLSAAPFAIPGRDEAGVAVVLRTDPAADAAVPPAAASEGPRRDEASVVVAALDAQGKIIGTVTQSARIPWAPGGSRPAPYELLSRLELKPGRYEIRAAADLASGQRSSVYGFVEVPDFAAARLSMSGIVLQALPGGVSGPKDAFVTHSFASIPLPIVPTARRSFVPTDLVTVFLRVYRRSAEGAAPVVTGQVIDAGGRVVYDSELDANVSDYQLDLPIERFSPGEYVLQIRGSAGEENVSRSVRFTIR
jgi:VWFA-related protein